MALKFTDLTGSLEAAWDGCYHVILREKGTTGPNFHLTRSLVEELLVLFPSSSGCRTVHERAMANLASGCRSWADLSPEHALALLEKYPVLFREAWVAPTTPASRFACDGFEIYDGWFHIVDRLSARLSKDTAIHVVQIKEKYGRLKVYFEFDENAAPDPRLDAEIEAAICEAADESERTCEVCGEPGTSEMRRNWVTVRCEPCLQIEEKTRKP